MYLQSDLDTLGVKEKGSLSSAESAKRVVNLNCLHSVGIF